MFFRRGKNIQNQTHTPKQQAQSKVTTSSSVDFSSLFVSFLKKTLTAAEVGKSETHQKCKKEISQTDRLQIKAAIQIGKQNNNRNGKCHSTSVVSPNRPTISIHKLFITFLPGSIRAH